MSDLVPKSPMELVDPQAQIIVDFLKGIGLPHDNIIATLDERAIIGKNLPGYQCHLPKTIPPNQCSPFRRFSRGRRSGGCRRDQP